MPRAVEQEQKETRDAGLTVADYFRRIETGKLDSADRVELWNGQIVNKMSKNPPHQAALTKLMRSLFRLVPEGWFPTQESPVSIGDNKVPEPDAMVLRGDVNDFSQHPPAGKDAALIIEVSASSLGRDLGAKKTAYAAEGVPYYWVVNLTARRVEVHSEPKKRGKQAKYDKILVFKGDDAIPVVLDGVEVGRIVVSEILP